MSSETPALVEITAVLRQLHPLVRLLAL